MTSVTGYVMTCNYNYKDQPMCQNGWAIKDIWSRFVDIPNVDDRVENVIAYARSTWLDSRLWPPHSWSAFKSSVTTNNVVEGWHNRRHHHSHRGQLDVYQLAPLLHQKAEFISVQALMPIPGLYVPLHFCSRERKDHRENFRSMEHSLLGTFAPVELSFLGSDRKNFRSYETVVS